MKVHSVSICKHAGYIVQHHSTINDPNSKKWGMSFCYFIEWTILEEKKASERERENNITTFMNSITSITLRNISTNKRIEIQSFHRVVKMRRRPCTPQIWKFSKLKWVSTFVFILWFISLYGVISEQTISWKYRIGHSSIILT